MAVWVLRNPTFFIYHYLCKKGGRKWSWLTWVFINGCSIVMCFLCSQVPCADGDIETWETRCYNIPQGSQVHWRPCSCQEGLQDVVHCIQRWAVQHQGLLMNSFLYVRLDESGNCHNHPLILLLRWGFVMRKQVSTCSTSSPTKSHLQGSCPLSNWWQQFGGRSRQIYKWRTP